MKLALETLRLKLLLFALVARADDSGITDVHSGLICSHEPIKVFAGDDVILPCQLQPPVSAESETVMWTRPDLKPEFVHFHQDGRLIYQNQNPSYYYRTRLFVDELINGNVSMKIFKVESSDSGIYKCSLPSIQKEASIQLIVREPEVIGTPEPVEVEVGDVAILPCHLEPPFNVMDLIVEWEYSGTSVDMYRHGMDDPSEQDERFKGRAFFFGDEEITKGNVSLKLTSVTKLDEGNYTCEVWVSGTFRDFCHITLTVTHEKKDEIGSGTEPPGDDDKTILILLIVLAVFTVLLLAELVSLCYRMHRAGRGMEQVPQSDAKDNSKHHLRNSRDLTVTFDLSIKRKI